jgi:hypothetical protein
MRVWTAGEAGSFIANFEGGSLTCGAKPGGVLRTSNGRIRINPEAKVDGEGLWPLDWGMRFLAPGFLHLAWLLVIPVVLYLYRREARRVQVSTLLFFRLLAREHQESAWLRKLKRWLSLLLTLLILTALVLALGRPIWSGGEAAGALVVVVDRSASMAAKDEQGVTRLDEAKRRVRAMLTGVSDMVPVTLVALDGRAEVVLGRSRDRRECLRRLEALEAQPMEDRAEAGWRVARRMAALEEGSRIWWVSDEETGDEHAGEEPKGERNTVDPDGVVWVDVGLRKAGVNVGITGFQVRALPLERDRLEGFLQVSAAVANPGRQTVRLEVQVGGRLAQLRELELEPGQQQALTLPLEGVQGQEVEARVFADGDCLGWDDAVVARIPQSRALRVAWYAEKADPFTELAFQSLVEAGRIEMWRGDTAVFPPADMPDVYVFENWLPEAWPGDRPVIALRPPKSAGPLKVQVLPGGGVPHPSVRVTLPDHPVVFRAVTGRVELTQSALFEMVEGLEALWMAGDEPVLAAGEVQGQRMVVGAFTPAKSEQLALLPAFPLVLGNALLWCADDPVLKRGLQVVRAGETLEQRGRVDWRFWDGEAFQAEALSAEGWVTVNRVGAWIGDDGRSGISMLASMQETDVPMQTDVVLPGPKPADELSVRAGFGWTVVQGLLLGLLVLLVVESYLFHRQAVY